MIVLKKNLFTFKLHEKRNSVKYFVIIFLFVLTHARIDFDLWLFELTLNMIFIE